MNFETAGGAGSGLRPVDRLVILVEVLFAVYWLFAWGRADVVPIMVGVHLAGALLPIGIVRLAARGGRWHSMVRMLYPVVLIGLHWSEAGVVYANLHESVFDAVVAQWDLALFRVHLQEVWLPAMPYVWLSEIMLLLYFTYYPVVFGTPLLLAVTRRHDATADIVFRLFVTYMACFFVYLFFPVEGPKTSMGRADGPHTAGFFYRLIESLTEAGDSLGTAFPSSHVAGMMALAIAGLKWFGRPVNIALMALAIGMTISTVYVQHHFAIDALAGVVLAVACALAAPGLKKGLMLLPIPDFSVGGTDL